jgi:ApaG protein
MDDPDTERASIRFLLLRKLMIASRNAPFETNCPVAQAMYSSITQDIQITVKPEFVPERSDADQATFFWAYTVEIANQSDQTVQLTARHWRITDGNGRLEEVLGSGVVGEQPILRPGESFRYTSGCPLSTPSGIMTGTYRMVAENGAVFDAAIPVFSLDSPYVARVLN